jgi:hypothetical protein
MAGKKMRTLADRMRKVISTHPRYGVGIMVCFALAGVLVLAGVVLFLVALLAREPLAIAFGGLLLLAGGGVGALTWRHMYLTPAEVSIYPFGVKWTARGREFEYDWDEVAEVYRSEVITISRNGRSRNAYVILHFEDGETLKCTNALRKYDDLAGRLMSETSNTLLSRAREQMKDKDGVDFGPVEFHSDGVTIDDDFYPWDELRQTRVRNGHIIFYFPRKQKYEFPLSQIPNYLVLFGLLDEMGKAGIIDQRPDPD